MKDLIICDLDGTLANCDHRRHLVENKPKRFEEFYQACDLDTVHGPILNLLQTYLTHLDHKEIGVKSLLFVTGRPERTREKTVEWLERVGYGKCNFRRESYQLLMRADDDTRPDYVVKQEILDRYIDKRRVLFVLDDRQQVVDMWRRNGLTCLQVAPGNF